MHAQEVQARDLGHATVVDRHASGGLPVGAGGHDDLLALVDAGVGIDPIADEHAEASEEQLHGIVSDCTVT
jgi:hypothetical protein